MTVAVERIPEFGIGPHLRASLQNLLGECFPGYPERDYFKLPPQVRYVATSGDRVVGQLGLELRVIRVGDHILRTFGVSDVCVREASRGQGLAARMLREVTGFAVTCGMDAVFLFADDDRLYTREGWIRVGNPLSWVKIDEHATIGLARSVVPHELMVKCVGWQQPWPAGEVDLLGHVC